LLLDVAREAIHAALPGAAVAGDPLRHLGQLGGAEPALARPPDLLGDDKLGGLEDPDVLLDPVDRQAERRGELSERRGTVAQALQDPAPGRIRQREECAR
jgi:hypothetical protein